MGTPAYMPPEQALGEVDRLDERSDVFGLGAILCEFLTGTPPYVGGNGTEVYRMASRGKLDDALTRLDACGADGELLTLARECLEVEQDDRPRDAGVLAERVTGYLESVESKLRETELAKVDAQVRSEELRRRHKLALTAGVTIVATLIIGISLSVWQAMRATAAETLAIDQADRATAAERQTAETLKEVAGERDAKEQARKDAADVSGFLESIFRSPDPERDGSEIKVVELLDTAAKKLQTGLADQPASRAHLQDTLGRTYHALGLSHKAIRLQENARDFCLATYGPEHPVTRAVMTSLANSYFGAHRLDEAFKLREDVLRLDRKLLDPEHPNVLISMHNLSCSYTFVGRTDDAIKLVKETLALRRKVLGPEHPDTLTSLRLLSLCLGAGRSDEAIKMQEELLPIHRRVLGPKHPETLRLMTTLARYYDAADRDDEALKLREELVALSSEGLGAEHPSTLFAMSNLVGSYSEAGRQDEALELQEKVVSLCRKNLGEVHPQTLGEMTNLAGHYANAGRLDEAVALQEKTLALKRQAIPNHSYLPIAIDRMSHLYIRAGHPDKALPLVSELLEFCVGKTGNSSRALRVATLQAWFAVGDAYGVTRKRTLAWAASTDDRAVADHITRLSCLRPIKDAELRKAALKLGQRTVTLGQDDKKTLPWSRLALGMAEYRNAQYEQSAQTLATATASAADTDDKAHVARITGTAKFYRAMCLFQKGKRDEARTLFNATAAKMKPYPADEKNPHADDEAHGDDLILWLAYREAKALLQISTTKTPAVARRPRAKTP